MLTLTLLQVDVFTTECLKGNACAVVLDSDQLNDEIMQQIARELNKSETAFILESDTAKFGARFFTPSEEIPLAGGAAIASVCALLELGRVNPKDVPTIVTLDLREGPVDVEVWPNSGKSVMIVMSQRKPEFKRIYEPSSVLKSFGLSHEDLLPQLPVQTVSTGTPHLIVPLRGLKSLKKANLDIEAYREFHQAADFFSPHLFCLEGATENGQTFSRHFGVPPDLPEGAFTASATGGLGAYLWHYNLIEHPKFVAEQGHWMNRPGAAVVEVVGPRDGISAVKVGGHAVAAFRGQLFLSL
jgi:trans-2,3-dihydro-3-hydroxyanthranilate isomerase